jgi:hypothetical protein
VRWKLFEAWENQHLSLIKNLKRNLQHIGTGADFGVYERINVNILDEKPIVGKL